jgi:hypothetical protein
VVENDLIQVEGERAWKREPSLLRQQVRPEDVVLTYEENPFEFAEGWTLGSVKEEWNASWNKLSGGRKDEGDGEKEAEKVWWDEEEGDDDRESEGGCWGEEDHCDDDESSLEDQDGEPWPACEQESDGSQVEKEGSVVAVASDALGSDAFGRMSLYPSDWNCATDGGKICCF